MRVVGLILIVAAFGSTEARASSIETLPAMSGPYPSIITLGDSVAIDPSIVAAVAETGPSPSIVALADTPGSRSIISLGGPPPAGEDDPQRASTPTVIRGGEVGQTYARPAPARGATPAQAGAPAQASAPQSIPLLDPNDKGTSSKRKALKRQAARLAQEAAAAAQNPQPDPSTKPVPKGQ